MNPSPNLLIPRPDQYADPWYQDYLRLVDILDGSMLGNLFVTPAEWPSASLSVVQRSGYVIRPDGTFATMAETEPFALPNNVTSWVWLVPDPDESFVGRPWTRFGNVLPASGRYLPLAAVQTVNGKVGTINDCRVGFSFLGS